VRASALSSPGCTRRRRERLAIAFLGFLGCVVGCGHIGYDAPVIPFEVSGGSGGIGSVPDADSLEDAGRAPEPDVAVAGDVGGDEEGGAAPVDEGGSEPVPDGEADSGLAPQPEGGVGRCDDQAPIRLYEWNVQTASSTDAMNYSVKLENHTRAPIPLETLTARYYFTNELVMPWTAEVYYSDICCNAPVQRLDSKVVASCHAMTPTTNADSYLEFGFVAGAGDLAAGDAVQVEIAFHAPAYDRNLTQSNDYSYTPIGGTQIQWDACPGAACAKFRTCAITVYRDGVLVWGTPP
jgi:hypothetical protein